MQNDSSDIPRAHAASRGLAAADEQRSVGDYFDAIPWDERVPDPAELTAEEFLADF